MRFWPLAAFCLFLLLPPHLKAQNRDTAGRKTASEQPAKIEFIQDSFGARRIRQEVAKHGKPMDVFLQERREMEKAAQRKKYYRIGFGALFLLLLAFVFIQRRQK